MPAAGDVIYAVDEGVVAVELPQLAGRRRIVDFLYPGDVISSRAMLGCNEVRLRAVEAASVVRHGRAAWFEGGHAEEPLLKLEQGVRRAQLAGLMTGLVDLDQRLASFLLSYCRRRQAGDADSVVEVTITREDVASYLHINPDTLSRCYSRLRELGVVGRGSRQRLVIRDPIRLASLTPLAALIDAERR